MAKTTEPPAPVVHVVTESFVIDALGAPVAYRRGELVEADDPLIRKLPKHFAPFEFPHPIRRHGFAEKMAAAKAAKAGLGGAEITDVVVAPELRAE